MDAFKCSILFFILGVLVSGQEENEVFAGVTFGKKLKCLSKEISVCVQRLYFSSLEEKNPCSQMPHLVDCFKTAVKECKDEGKEAIRNIVNILQEICETNSQLYKDLLTSSQCFQKPTFQLNFIMHCLAEYTKDLEDLRQPITDSIQEYADRLHNFICPNREKLVSCGYSRIRSDCGILDEGFFRQVMGPFDDLLKESCDDSAGSAGLLSMSKALVFLPLFIALFSLIRNF